MDPKASPLAMLAKTCSQIGADPPLPLSKINKPKTPPSSSLDPVKKDSVSPPVSSKDSRSRSSSAEIKVTDTVGNNHTKSDSKSSSSAPIVRPGIEVLTPSIPTPRAIPPTVSYPSSLSVTSQSNSSSVHNNPFLASFAHSLSTNDSTMPGVCRDPLCRDPLCPTALRNQQLLGGYSYANLLASASPHYREAMMAMAAQQRMLAASMATSQPPHANGALPHVCGWMLGKYHLVQVALKLYPYQTLNFCLGSEYCGRRFATTEELLIHLKTHTNLSTSDPRALLSASSNGSTSGPRFHPYARIAASGPPPPPTAPLPPPPSLSLAAFASSPYASLYSSLFSRPPLL